MTIYKRNIKKKLFSLRLLLIIFLLVLLFAFISDLKSLWYFVATIFIFLNLIVVSNIEFSTSEFKIIKSYCFGLIPIAWRFSRGEEILIWSDGTGFSSDIDTPNTFFSGTDYDLPFGCLYPIIGKATIEKIRFSVQKVKPGGKRSLKVYIFMDQYEYNMLNDFFAEKHDR